MPGLLELIRAADPVLYEAFFPARVPAQPGTPAALANDIAELAAKNRYEHQIRPSAEDPHEVVVFGVENYEYAKDILDNIAIEYGCARKAPAPPQTGGIYHFKIGSACIATFTGCTNQLQIFLQAYLTYRPCFGNAS